jgi:hypothetical protein
MDLTAEQINKHIEKFTPIYKDGKEENPIPKDRKVTVWCEGTEEQGFACNVTANEMGLEALIAQSWIDEDYLQKLCAVEKNLTLRDVRTS